MDKNQFDFDKTYSARFIAETFALPVFVTRRSWAADFCYRITSVEDVVKGEDWRDGRPVRKNRTYQPSTTFLVCPHGNLKFRADAATVPPAADAEVPVGPLAKACDTEDVGSPFPVVVMATMSCGKSTLINALLGKSILPSRNEACTAKAYYIYDNDDDGVTRVILTDRNGKRAVFDRDWAAVLEEANGNADILDVRIESQIKGVINTRKRLMMIDTPGTNNSRDGSHEQVTARVLESLERGMVLYVINAEQFGIKDDRRLLLQLADALRKKPHLSALFVINKTDSIDTEKEESLEGLVRDVRCYITENSGIQQPEVIPVSALSAHLFKQVLKREPLTRKDARRFKEAFELYCPQGLDLTAFAVTRDFPAPGETVEVGGTAYRASDIMGALANTGIPYLERYVQNAQIESERTAVRKT